MSPAPSGRSGRLVLQHRLRTARHAAEVLEHKRHLLAAELAHLVGERDTARREWERQAATARRWLDRAGALDGADGVRRAAATRLADARVQEGAVVGVVHPVAVDCRLPARPAVSGSSALVQAVAAHRRATEAAVRLAALERAVALLETELAGTRGRQRAVERRWIPELEGQLDRLEVALDELEREEHVRARWAATTARRGVGGSAAGSPGRARSR